jgi:hypothetical protein
MEGVMLICLIGGCLCCVGLGYAIACDVERDGNRLRGQRLVQQEAVDRGHGFWTIIAGVPVFQWAEEVDDDTAATATSAATASSCAGEPGEQLGAARDY